MSYGLSIITDNSGNQTIDHKSDKTIIRSLDSFSVPDLETNSSQSQTITKFKGQDIYIIYNFLDKFQQQLLSSLDTDNDIDPEPNDILQPDQSVFPDYGYNIHKSDNESEKLIFQTDNILIGNIDISARYVNLYKQLLYIQNLITQIPKGPQTITDLIPQQQLQSFAIKKGLSSYEDLVIVEFPHIEYNIFDTNNPNHTIRFDHIDFRFFAIGLGTETIADISLSSGYAFVALVFTKENNDDTKPYNIKIEQLSNFIDFYDPQYQEIDVDYTQLDSSGGISGGGFTTYSSGTNSGGTAVTLEDFYNFNRVPLTSVDVQTNINMVDINFFNIIYNNREFTANFSGRHWYTIVNVNKETGGIFSIDGDVSEIVIIYLDHVDRELIDLSFSTNNRFFDPNDSDIPNPDEILQSLTFLEIST